MLRKIRIALATVFFLGLSLLFLDFTGVIHHWLGWMAKVQALEAVLALNAVVVAALVVLTLVFGRIYCSVICPLGVMQDLFGWLGKKAKKNRYNYSAEKRWLRYPILVVFIAALVAGGGTVVQLLAPYSAFGRIMTMILQPIWKWGNNVLAAIAESMDSYAFYEVDVWLKSMPVLIIATLTLALLMVLAWRNGRTYCNTICPVGTVLSFFSRFSLFKIHFDADKCRNCSLCSKNCKAACIDYKTHSVDHSRCVTCGDCLDSCKFGALKYSISPKQKKAETNGTPNDTSKPADASKRNNTPADAGKRSFLVASAMVTTAAALAQEEKIVDGGFTDLEDKVAPTRQTPLTPPGSLSDRNFSQRCTGCQLCVSECPNHVLRPSTDLMHLMQPTMSYERGFCRPECTRCSDVCPAGAIRPLDDIEKSSIQIGHAVWIKKNCIPVTKGVECGNCANHCPAGAIEMVALDEEDEESPFVPAINESACIGCGACEYVCPARPFSAIYVEGHEVHKTI
jgi:polyferredoxin